MEDICPVCPAIRPLEPEKKEWCEHVKYENGREFVKWGTSSHKEISETWKFCPVCGKARPE